MVTALICLLVVAITLISSYSVVTVSSVNMYKEDYGTRSLLFGPMVTDEAIDAVSSVEHVELVTDVHSMLFPTCLFSIKDSTTADFNEQTIYVSELYENQKIKMVKGEDLDDVPAFSCLVPSIFYPYSAYENDFKDLEYIDGRTLIGQTITIGGLDSEVDFRYYTYNNNQQYEYTLISLPVPEFTLTVVGTYYCSYITSGSFETILVSRETGLQMTQTALEEAGVDLSTSESGIAQWWNTPYLHEYFVVVDDYSNISEVSDTVSKMGYNIGEPLKRQDDTTVLIANLFKIVGTFLTVAIVFISVVILVQSSLNSINERKGYIGLMKAIGYKNRQVFLTLLWEQLYLSLRAFAIGGALSTVLAYLINLYFEHGTYRQLQYVMDWNVYFAFLGLAFLIVLLVPIVTELILIRKLVKIEPRDAMNTQ